MERKRNKQEVLLFFLMLSVIYVFPIIHADYLFFDDQWRSLLRDSLWTKLGRLFVELLYRVLTFTPSMPTIFPLPLLCSMVAISFAMRNLVFYLYTEVDFSKCLVVLPLLCSPFFLGNLTYQYDGPAMVLAVAAIVAAITWNTENAWLSVFVPALFITVALGLYQLVLSMFVGLCCFEIIVRSQKQAAWHVFFATALSRGAQLLLGAALYFFTVYRLADTDRGALLAFDSNWPHMVGSRMALAAEKISVLNMPGVTWMWGSLAFLAGTGSVFLVGTCLANAHKAQGKVAVLTVLLLMVMALLLCVPGVVLYLNEGHMHARDLMGFSVLLIMLFYLAREALFRIYPWALIFLMIPCLYMFSISYMYGQVLIAKKEYEISLSSHIAYDLTSRVELRNVVDFNFYAPYGGDDAYWVPASEGTMRLMPVIKYLLTKDNIMLFAERFQRVGVNRVFWVKDSINKAMAENKGQLIVDNKQYRIYRVGYEGFIQIKSPEEMVAP